jgi:formamidopyrimidine-DNA glycosylase|tara:strand:- start:94 stop:942 length:849 start_codon:yes stop_codon:yes gene_type:complete
MPELPEVEVLARHLDSALGGKTIRAVVIHRPKSIRPTRAQSMRKKLVGARFKGVTRRAKYLLFEMKLPKRESFMLLGHLGMTGRMYLQSAKTPLPKHAAVSFGLGRYTFVFEDTRYFGRMTLDESPLETLGPEPLSDTFCGNTLRESLRRTTQAIKPKLLGQSLLAGVGNIYASEALFRARISPRKMGRRLSAGQCDGLAEAIREVLAEAIECGSTVPLDFAGQGAGDGLFYYGSAPDAEDYEERLRVYDREGEPCDRCDAPIRKIIQTARSTYYCAQCQRG